MSQWKSHDSRSQHQYITIIAENSHTTTHSRAKEKGVVRLGGCERSCWDLVCRGSGESLKAKSDAWMCVKIRALCNKDYSKQPNYQLSPSHQLALQRLHFRCCLQGQFKVLLQGKKLFLFWTWALVGLISLSEINEYWLSAISAHDTRLSSYSWQSTLGLWMPSLTCSRWLLQEGRKRMSSLEISHQLIPLPLLDLQGRLQGLDSQTHHFSGFFLFYEDFIF